jgi:hypothetical protein
MLELNLLEFFSDRELSHEIELVIHPQSPLSISGVLNSKYVKCKRSLSDNMIYGLIENMIGFHFGRDVRKKITKICKLNGVPTDNHHTEEAYLPLISDLCKVINVNMPIEKDVLVDDYSSHFKSSDSRSFATSTHDISLLGVVTPRKGYKIDNYNLYSNYYKSIGHREYMVYSVNDKITVRLQISTELMKIIQNKIQQNQILYLGNSESLINIELKQL